MVEALWKLRDRLSNLVTEGGRLEAYLLVQSALLLGMTIASESLHELGKLNIEILSIYWRAAQISSLLE